MHFTESTKRPVVSALKYWCCLFHTTAAALLCRPTAGSHLRPHGLKRCRGAAWIGLPALGVQAGEASGDKTHILAQVGAGAGHTHSGTFDTLWHHLLAAGQRLFRFISYVLMNGSLPTAQEDFGSPMRARKAGGKEVCSGRLRRSVSVAMELSSKQKARCVHMLGWGVGGRYQRRKVAYLGVCIEQPSPPPPLLPHRAPCVM